MSTAHLVRASDPISSALAAERTTEFAPSQCDRILAAVRGINARQLGATAAEIGEVCNLTVVQVDRRLPELRRAGRVTVLQYDGGDLMRGGYRCWGLGSDRG